MTIEYNVYCDESCHLENDGHKAMVLGAVWCPKDKRLEIAKRIREIKEKHGVGRHFEIKWTSRTSTIRRRRQARRCPEAARFGFGPWFLPFKL